MNIRITSIILFAAVFFSLSLKAQNPAPAPAQKSAILIVGGIAHLGNGDKIVDAAIGFENGKINFVGYASAVNRSNYKEIISAEGKHIYPGFIAPNSTLGLMEVGAVRATNDYREVGDYKPNVRAIIAYNTDSDITPTVRTNGVLYGQITPRGGTIPGSSGVVQFDAWNWEDAAISECDGVHMNWPRVFRKNGAGSEKPGIQKEKNYEENLLEIQEFFAKAKAYSKSKNLELQDLKMEAMRGLFDGSLNLYVNADDIKQISEAVQFKKDFDIKNMVIVGGYDSWLLADMLRDNNIPVMIRRVHELPVYNDDDFDLPFKLPKLLQDEGVLFCLENSGDMEQMGTRNLPFYAGTAIAYGLTYEQAVMSMSLNTAKILGVDDRIGSLEIGKDASLFISEGDAFDMKTNKINHAFIEGRSIDLDNKQKQLYRKYRTKYARPQ